MTGQREQKFGTTPRYNTRDVNPAASIRTDQSQAVAAQSTGTRASALAGLGGAMANFFGTAAKTVDSIAEIEHRETMVEIERQNEARAVQAAADHAAGKERDEGLNKYQAYKGSYDVAVADAEASRLADDLSVAMRNLPNTPDVNPEKFATEFIKDQVRGGTGDPAVDGRMAYSVKRRADALVAHKREQIAQTSERNIAETITKGLTRKMMEQRGVTTEDTDGFYSEALGLAKGDVGKADKLFTDALSRAIYNPGHANSTLAALRESGFAKRNPDVYMELTEKAWHRTNQVKSVAAGLEVEEVNSRYQTARAAYDNQGLLMPTEEYLGYLKDAIDVNSRHGVGTHAFPWMGRDLDHGAARKALKDQAAANEIVQAWSGLQDGSLRRVLSMSDGQEEFGKVMSKKFIPAVNTIMTQQGAAEHYPDLAAAQQPGGGYNFLATRKSAQQFARLLAKKPDAFGYSVDDNTAAQFADAIMSGNPERTMIAVDGATTLQNTPGGEQFLRSLLRDPKARARFDVIQNRARDSGGLENAVRLVTNDKSLEDREGKEIQDGQIDWKRATRDGEAKRVDIENDIDKKAKDVFLSGQDRSAWYKFDPKVNLHPALQDKLYRLASRHAYEQQANLPLGSKPDMTKAAQWAAKEIQAESVPITAQNGVLRYVPDPYGGRGRQLKDPIGVYGGRKVFAGTKLVNAFGEEEDPQKTFVNIDRKAIQKTFTGFGSDGKNPGEEDEVYLMPPDQKTGLHPVVRDGQVPLAFYAGMKVRVNDKDVTVPASPTEADSFFASTLPAGFSVIKGAADAQGRNTYRVAYGYRMVGDEEAAARKLTAQHQERKDVITQRKQNLDPDTGAVQLQMTPTAFARP